MKVVFKYAMPAAGFFRILELPEDAVVVKTSTRQNVMYAWILLDPLASKVRRHFGTVATGQEFPASYLFHDTVFDGGLVWHLIEDPAARGGGIVEGRDYG